MPTLGKFIQRRRRELGYTQEQLAEMIGQGVRQSEISRLEHDRVRLPRRHRLEQLAVALDVSLGQLLARSGWADAEEEFDGVDRAEAANGERTPPPVHRAAPANGDAAGQALADTHHLSAALARAEHLIAQTDAVVEKSQVAVSHAQRSVRYTRSNRRKDQPAQ